MPPKRDEAALQEEEELQLAIALSQSEAEEKERMVGYAAEKFAFTLYISSPVIESGTYMCVYLQRHKNSYSMYPKADPTPVTSSAPPVSTLYTSPVVRPSCNLNCLHSHLCIAIKNNIQPSACYNK